MVRIDRVITRGGDGGETSLGDGRRVGKDDARVEAFGTVDEANAVIGVLRTMVLGPEDAMLARIQNDLFDVGADLCVPGVAGERLRLTDAPSRRLEAEVAAMNAGLPPLTSFVLPGGSPGGRPCSNSPLTSPKTVPCSARTWIRNRCREFVSSHGMRMPAATAI